MAWGSGRTAGLRQAVLDVGALQLLVGGYTVDLPQVVQCFDHTANLQLALSDVEASLQLVVDLRRAVELRRSADHQWAS